jgi:monoamine oxidase
VTIPLKVLAKIPSDFSAAHQAAIGGVNYGNAIKIAWQSRRFWETDDNIYGGTIGTEPRRRRGFASGPQP